MREGWPLARPGRVIGLLGGSFDPAHAGHAHITREALKRFRLDEIWWLVTPGNPLKARGPAELDDRMRVAREVMRHPKVRVTALEARLGTRYTAETISGLQEAYPGVTFVWLMGADNLATFHRWQRWEAIFHMAPIGVLARPGERISARLSPAARRFRPFKLSARQAGTLKRRVPPAWCFVNMPMRDESSTAIRAGGGW
ncbi:MAG: nicotinate-nucleotide adenylyltransferase [Paracoccaceae bacterium]|nr:nicotinate-nucleotide adenylyltransferase [Paracoccaceae bacterium]